MDSFSAWHWVNLAAVLAIYGAGFALVLWAVYRVSLAASRRALREHNATRPPLPEPQD